ncbi:LamG domain-containing protein [Catenovulum sediminis]|uniref:LamG domain-containing protein n=1 Tax=Catenovulum sediminis TaxID=1740262 RepID=A0ABV1RD66_9ALTE|nr:LamG domain-containing protein [Catenovulum sediminis]
MKKLFFLLLLALLPSTAWSAGCEDVFSAAIGSHHSQGQITMYANSRISNEPHPDRLPFVHIRDQIAPDTCGRRVTCGISGQPQSGLTLPPFLASNNTRWISLNGGHHVFSDEHNGNITLNSNATASFSQVNGTYRFAQLTLNTGAELVVPPGDYYFGSLTLNDTSNIRIDVSRGRGTVRFHVQNQVTVNSRGINRDGDPDNLVIYIHANNSYNSLALNTASEIVGFVYVDGDNTTGRTTINASGLIRGRLSTGSLIMNSEAAVEYAGVINQVDFGHNVCSQTDTAPVLQVHYQFDQGSGQIATDSSANARNLTLGISNAADNQDPSWQCHDTNKTYLAFDASANQRALSPSFTPPANGLVAFWMKVDAMPTSRQRIFGFGDGFEARWEAGNTIYWDIQKTDTNTSISSNLSNNDLNKWVHLAIAYSSSNNTWSVYKDGIQVARGSETLTAQGPSQLTLGGSTWQPNSESFNGALEDFRIYSGVLSQQQITNLAATPPVDCISVDHYEITHDSQALTCNSAAITVKACATADCRLYDQVTQASLTKTISRRTEVVDNHSFTGSKSVTLRQSTPATITLGLQDLSPSAPVTCNGNGNCQLVFSDSGFVVSQQNIESCTTGTVTIQALKSDGSQNCAPAWSGHRRLQILFSHRNKQGNAAIQLAGHAYSIGHRHTISASFDRSAQASFHISYPDAGAVTLQVTDPEGILNTGSAVQNFYPNKIVLSSDSTNNHPINSAFSLNLSAQCSDNRVTPSYQANQMQFDLQRISPDPASGGVEANLTYNSSNGQVTSQSGFNNTSGLTFVEGAYSHAQSKIDEYGLYQLQARDLNYLSATTITSNNLTLGTFIPASLQIYNAADSYPNGYTDARAAGQYANQINNSYSYLGQSFSYTTRPVIAVLALDSAGNAIKNYTTALGTANLVLDLNKVSSAATDNGFTLTSSFNAGILTDNADGSFSYQLGADSFSHQKNAQQNISPFNTHIPITFAAGAFYDLSNGAIASSSKTITPNSAYMVNARLNSTNNYGPETDNLQMLLKVQYFDGSNWLTATADNTTRLASSQFTIGGQTHAANQNWLNRYTISSGDTVNLLSPATTTNQINALNGQLNFTFAAPGAGNQGSLSSTIDLTSIEYLQYDWDNSGTLNSAITTEMTWGIFRGNDRVIFWREVY